MIYSAEDKDPNAVLDYTFSWVDFLGEDTIATSTFPNFPTGITQGTTSHTGDTVTVWLSGGTLDQSYRITNRITTAQGRTEDWLLVVRVTEDVIVPDGPPYATVQQAAAYQPKSDGADAMKVEMVLQDASDLVHHVVPPPDDLPETKLASAMDASQKTVPLDDNYHWPETGAILIDSELIFYNSKATSGNDLTKAIRGRNGSLPASHTSGTAVTEVGYAIRARRAELAVFEWLWDTRGYIPGKSGVIGSESYSIGDEVFALIKRIMGPYYGGEGGIRGVVPMGSFRRYRMPYDIQRGSYNIG